MYVLVSPKARLSVLSRLILLAAVVCLSGAGALAQAASADYTTDLPSVAQVESGIQGSDPTDTLARQVAVFTYLQTYVQRIAYNRGVRAPYTAGEQKMVTAYYQAATQLTQDYGKAHTAAELTAFNQLHGRYEMNETFNDAWQKSLIGPMATAAYNGSVSSMAAGQAAHVAQEQQQYQQDKAAQQNTGNVMGSDATSVAARRCLELGGDSSSCLGSSLVGGIVSLFTGGAGLGAITGPGRAGVVLSGNYGSGGTSTSIDFGNDTAGIDHCGDLQEVDAAYTIRKSSAGTQVILQSKSGPITLSMRSDGSLAGPALVEITGQVITGYNTVTNTQMINGARAAPNQCNGPCQTISQVPVYAPKTVRCSLASFAAPPPPPPPSTSGSDSSAMGGIFGAITGMMGSAGGASLPGLRMEGKYSSSSGLILDFAGDAVTMDCGQAHVKAPYTVVNGPGSFTVNVQNSGGAFVLTLGANSALTGSGSTTVNGRLVSGVNGDNVTFTPHSETCAVTTLTPQTAASSSSVAANSSPVSAPVPATAPAAVAATAPAAAASGAGMKLNITSTFPIATNPLAGKPVKLMTDRFDSALRAIGAPIPAGTTPGKALQAWAYACSPPKDCTAPAKLMAKYYVGSGTFDSTGKVVLMAPVAPGTYYVFTSVAGTKGVLVWDMPIALKAGDNTINLTATNAELVQ